MKVILVVKIYANMLFRVHGRGFQLILEAWSHFLCGLLGCIWPLRNFDVICLCEISHLKFLSRSKFRFRFLINK